MHDVAKEVRIAKQNNIDEHLLKIEKSLKTFFGNSFYELLQQWLLPQFFHIFRFWPKTNNCISLFRRKNSKNDAPKMTIKLCKNIASNKQLSFVETLAPGMNTLQGW